MRTLLILIAVIIVVLTVKRLFSAPRPEKNLQTHSGKMLQCAHCGMYVPETEALSHRGRDYCSAAHRDADQD
jgi:uncharacterized protein